MIVGAALFVAFVPVKQCWICKATGKIDLDRFHARANEAAIEYSTGPATVELRERLGAIVDAWPELRRKWILGFDGVRKVNQVITCPPCAGRGRYSLLEIWMGEEPQVVTSPLW